MSVGSNSIWLRYFASVYWTSAEGCKVAMNPGKYMTRKEICEAFGLSAVKVELHIRRMDAKSAGARLEVAREAYDDASSVYNIAQQFVNNLEDVVKSYEDKVDGFTSSRPSIKSTVH